MKVLPLEMLVSYSHARDKDRIKCAVKEKIRLVFPLSP